MNAPQVLNKPSEWQVSSEHQSTGIIAPQNLANSEKKNSDLKV